MTSRVPHPNSSQLNANDRVDVDGASLLQNPALRSGLITYLGNKRRLLPLIQAGFVQAHSYLGSIETVADPFAGSGVVSRLARLMGCEVWASDIEDYTRPGGRASLECTPEWVLRAFDTMGGYHAALKHLNSLPPLPEEQWYFARHYAPADTEHADPSRERMFFTHENAVRIDTVLDAIHHHLPLTSLEKDVLLAEVLVLMSIHNNTSGVMKGFHHGWGGRGGDALSRIMAPIEFRGFPFIAGAPGRMRIGPAADMVNPARVSADAGMPERFDLVYLDPPYTIHQYGANYHLLTSAVRWDAYDPGPVQTGSRAGIRTDHTRSDFCRRGSRYAEEALEEVLGAMSTRALLVSYNNDGIIPPERLLQMLSREGENHVELLSQEHPTFRGGKATQGSLKTNEYLFVVVNGRTQGAHERRELSLRVRELELQRDLTNQRLSPRIWQYGGGTARETAHRSWHLGNASGAAVELDASLRVTGVTAPDAESVRHAIEAAAINLPTTVETLIEMGKWEAAIDVLKRLKIKRYRGDFERLYRVLREAISEDTPEASEILRDRLDQLYERVTGLRAEDQ